MDSNTAKILVESLIGRLIRNDSGYELPGGRISAHEFKALQTLGRQEPTVAEHDGRGRDATENDEPSRNNVGVVKECRPSSHSVPLDLNAMENTGPPEEVLRLCLDFGTAMSKAWVTGTGVDETIPLILGRAAGTGDQLALPSSIYISKSGRIYLGAAAERQHRQELDTNPGRQRFDNIKRMLSDAEVGQDLGDVPIGTDIDPTNSGLTKGDLLTLYLAWLTDMALTVLLETQEISDKDEVEKARLIKRRFAIPCFENAVDEQTGGDMRASWANSEMSKAMLRSHVLADTLHGQWDSLRVEDILGMLSEVRKLDPQQLQHLFTEQASIREPIAAGASRFDEQFEDDGDKLVRRFMLVIDAGAGTTDFAMFQVFSQLDDEDNEGSRYALLKPSVRMNRIAGNAVDEVLRPLVLRACGIDPSSGNPRSDGDFALIKNDLNARIRSIKEVLFAEETVPIALQPNAKGTLSIGDLTNDPSFQDYGGQLQDTRRGIIQDLFSEDYLSKIRISQSAPVPIYVLLTGGSSSVPIIRSLGEGNIEIHDAQFQFHPIEELPGWIDSLDAEVSELVAEAYSQCAVAIGGSSLELPTEIGDLIHPVVPPGKGDRILETFRMKGN